jgi:uncharacterized protein involved in high-affinity Fe2+ transport
MNDLEIELSLTNAGEIWALYKRTKNELDQLKQSQGTLHVLKTQERYFYAVEEGLKDFELRKNDRDFKVGDDVHLECINSAGYPTGKILYKRIKYILKDVSEFGLQDGYCIIGLR